MVGLIFLIAAFPNVGTILLGMFGSCIAIAGMGRRGTFRWVHVGLALIGIAIVTLAAGIRFVSGLPLVPR